MRYLERSKCKIKVNVLSLLIFCVPFSPNTSAVCGSWKMGFLICVILVNAYGSCYRPDTVLSTLREFTYLIVVSIYDFYLTNTQHLLYARHSSKCLTHINYFNLYNKAMRLVLSLLSPFLRWEHWGTEKLNTLPYSSSNMSSHIWDLNTTSGCSLIIYSVL